ncbi:MAG TPA: sialidase family protein [Pirellulales bacterium]|nr:sialidase family protein [Pirellulales bacterium]
MGRIVLITETFFATLLCLPRPVAAVESVSVVMKPAFPEARQPQVAVSPLGKVYLVFGAGNSIFCTVSDNGGKSFGQPSKVGQVGALALGMRRGPRIAAAEKSVVVTAVGGERGHGQDGDLLAWRSDDGAKTWKGPVQVNGVPAAAREGLHHLAAAPDGTFYCVWLDLREKKTQVYGARSTDGGDSWHDERLIYKSPDGSVCQCCQPQVAYGPDGGLHVMWRNQLSGNRDMYFVNSKDNGRTFDRAAKLGHGTWPLDACPMDGGGLACDTDGRVVTIWRRDKEIFRCSPGESETLLGEGGQGWAAAGADGVYLTWTTGRPGHVMLLRPNSDTPAELAERGSNCVVAGAANGKGPVIAAWECADNDGPDRIRAVVLDRGR